MKRLLIASLTLNLLFISAASYFVIKRWHFARQPQQPPLLYLGRVDTLDKMPDVKADVVFIGDSLTEFCDWSELLQRRVINSGVSGDTVKGVKNRAERIAKYSPKKVFLMIGINDLLAGNEHIISDYDDLLITLRRDCPQATIYVQSILHVSPSWPVSSDKILAANEELKTLCDKYHLTYIDISPAAIFTSDGLHLTGDGYRKWAEVIMPYIQSTARITRHHHAGM